MRCAPNRRSPLDVAVEFCLYSGAHWRRASEAGRSSMAWRVSRVTNPEGWQIVAGGRGTAETPGSGLAGFGILEGCQSSATPSGVEWRFRIAIRGCRSRLRCASAFTWLRRDEPARQVARPPATFWQASGLLPGRPRDEQGGCAGRRGAVWVCIFGSLARDGGALCQAARYPMNITQIAVIGIGIGLTGQGIQLRKQQKPNWGALLIGGIIFLIAGLLSLAFGFAV